MLLIFDCDGVLVDSETLACQIDADILSGLGLPYTVDDITREFVGKSMKDMIARIEADHACTLPEDLSERINTALYQRFETELQPIDGVREAILALPYPRCVASSSVPERIALSLRVTGLADLFENVFSATQVAHGKPAPDLFLFAAERMGADPKDCLVIEDSTAGVQAAIAAGMRVIGFTGGSHCGPNHAQKLLQAGATALIERMEELPETILR
ncbi:HAD family hydrolase [Microvirga guangxiensis]|uniref:Haloacid dehalogenase superfamily, subfamily IA, variant 3 with third motif having DD or ED n=1 Tax=Microvirga guangxiensis TaxID=549386 RepID=A0A1G5JMA3_9HYPH|nr:HAD family hydrolase [Microvirga guangxiensis]SCY89294.1 haloacid dehalogenase superfamily, subfamily IA, variant 3 with third motif having DD or ED [Microvirga guangxiensis]